MKNTEQDTEMVEAQEENDDYEQKLAFLNAIAKPIASKKLAKRLFKCIKKGKFYLISSTLKLIKLLILISIIA